SLAKKSFVWSTLVEAHPEVPLEQPLYAWEPGGDAPPYATLTQVARRRFAGDDVTLRVYLATGAAAKVFGGHPGKLKPASTTHDLHLAAVYLRRLRREPA